MLLEAEEDLPDGIYIRFRTDGSLFNLRRLLARTKTIEELIIVLLFADDCALLAHSEEALQHIINRFSIVAKNFGLIISQKKTEVLYQPSPREAYSRPHISIDGTNLNAVEHFTYLGNVISNDDTVSKDLDNRMSKASSSFARLSEYGRVTRSASPQRSRYTGPSSFPPSCAVQRLKFSIGSRSGYWSGFTNAACAPSLASNGNTTNEDVLKRASLPSVETILLRAQLRRAGHVRRMEDVRMPKAVFFSEFQEGERGHGAPRKRYKDQLKRQLAQAGISYQSWQQEASNRDSWRSSVRRASCEFEAERHKSRKRKTQEAERASSIPTIFIPDLRLSKKRYGMRIKNWSLQPPTSMQELTINLPNNPRLQGMSHHHQCVCSGS